VVFIVDMNRRVCIRCGTSPEPNILYMFYNKPHFWEYPHCFECYLLVGPPVEPPKRSYSEDELRAIGWWQDHKFRDCPDEPPEKLMKSRKDMEPNEEEYEEEYEEGQN
jgi:hypothetical protein